MRTTFCYLLFLLLLTSCVTTQSFSSDKEKIDLIKEKIAEIDIKSDFHGGVMIMKNGEVLVSETMGHGSNGKSNNPETLIDIASIGKMFTGLSMLKLEEEGLIDLHRKMVDYLPNYPNRQVAEKVTVHDLLTHTSGIVDLFSFDFIEEYTKRNNLSMDEYWNQVSDNPYDVELFQKEDLRFEPGDKFEYSNSGYLILGLIIEQVTGMSYCEYIQEHFADMQNCRTSYGGGDMTMENMLTFANQLVPTQPISSSPYFSVFAQHIESGDDEYYGYGCIINQKYDTPIMGHRGGTMESKAQLMILPITGFTAVVYHNDAAAKFDGLDELRHDIMRVLASSN